MRLTYVWLAMIAACCTLAGVSRAADEDGYAWSDKPRVADEGLADEGPAAAQSAEEAAADAAAAGTQAAAADAAPVRDVGAPEPAPLNELDIVPPPPAGEEVRPGEEVLPEQPQPASAPAASGKHRLRSEYKQWCDDHGFADNPDKRVVRHKSTSPDGRLYAARQADERPSSRKVDKSREYEYADTSKETSDRDYYHARDYSGDEERAAARMADESIYDDSDRRDLDEDRYWSRSRLDGYYVGEQRAGCGGSREYHSGGSCKGCGGKCSRDSKCSKCGKCSDRCGKCRAKSSGCAKCGARVLENREPAPCKCGAKRRKSHRC